ncbi:MAG: tRNA pseudouridine(55) synthase TruB [Acidobacteria bacterium]|nr:tRNA pseudouridine(55) synthase TruB [Acidobacteriota bacterium]
MHGVLVVDKPADITSHDVVVRVRRALGTRAVGHTGTLDPIATGVLPLVVGKATRLARFLAGREKEYLVQIQLGRATDTYDRAGRPTAIREGASGGAAEGTRAIGRIAVEQALREFSGTFLQAPPPFSAKKIRGTPAHRLARNGQAPMLSPVSVTLHDVDLVALEDDRLTLRVVTSAGFYVRSLAHDLGQRLGCGAHVRELRRLRSGRFTLAQAATLDLIEAEGPEGARRLIPLAQVVSEFPAVVLTAAGTRRARQGNPVSPSDVRPPGPADTETQVEGGPVRLRLLDESGELVAIAERREASGVLHPTIVLG